MARINRRARTAEWLVAENKAINLAYELWLMDPIVEVRVTFYMSDGMGRYTVEAYGVSTYKYDKGELRLVHESTYTFQAYEFFRGREVEEGILHFELPPELY